MENKEVVVAAKRPGTPQIVKWFSWLGLLGLITVFVLLALYTDYSLGWLTLGAGAGLVLLLIVYFWGRIASLFAKKDSPQTPKDLPDPISLREAKLICSQLLTDQLGNEVDEPLDEGTEDHGKTIKQSIYFQHVRCKYANAGRPVEYFIGINMHYPAHNARIILNPTKQAIERAKRRLARNADDDPDIIVTRERNPLLGLERRITQRIKSSKKEEPKKEGDLE